ncbi:MAG: hypothetical protein MUC83_09370 [Pirellula sp.]|nr:hypothetical protein [Pirellula sp.]
MNLCRHSIVSFFVYTLLGHFNELHVRSEQSSQIVANDHVIFLNEDVVRTVTIATGETQEFPIRGEGTKVQIVDRDGVFAFFPDGSTPLLVDCRTKRQLKFKSFDNWGYQFETILSDQENIYVVSGKHKGIGAGSFEEVPERKGIVPGYLDIYSKKELMKSITSGDEIKASKIISTSNIYGQIIGGNINAEKLTIISVLMHVNSKSNSPISYSILSFELQGDEFSDGVNHQLTFRPLE